MSGLHRISTATSRWSCVQVSKACLAMSKGGHGQAIDGPDSRWSVVTGPPADGFLEDRGEVTGTAGANGAEALG